MSWDDEIAYHERKFREHAARLPPWWLSLPLSIVLWMLMLWLFSR
jgi:hypothetical protein